jgi:GntR family transcriptional regulator
MDLYVNPAGELPIYRQIAHQITAAIADERLKPGDRLPSHRDLAAQLIVAPLTVKKAYDSLESDGLIETQRGRGTFVSERPPAADPRESRERLREIARHLLSQAAVAGVSMDELVKLLAEMKRKGMEP